MILTLFITFLALAFGLIIFGYYQESDLMRIIGITMFFLCATTLSPAIASPLGDLEIQTGIEETIAGNTTTTNYIYTPYTNHTSSFYLMAFAILFGAYIWFERKEGRKG